MNFHSVSFWLAVIAIALVLITYVTPAPLMPIAIILIGLAVIFIGK